MPQQVRVTPWRNQTELLEVRRQFYPGAYVEQDERRVAIDVVKAWTIRGGLPAQVESTAALTAALMEDEDRGREAMPYCAEFGLSGALCLFVTRLVDPGRHNLYGRSMYKIAQELGLPASMVDIRHEATHGPPPSLVVLRRKAKEALQWLWEHYWMKIG